MLDGQRFRVVGVVPAVPITRRVGFSRDLGADPHDEEREYQKPMIGDFGAIVLARSTSRLPDAARASSSERLDALRVRRSEDATTASWPDSTRRSKPPRATSFGNKTDIDAAD